MSNQSTDRTEPHIEAIAEPSEFGDTDKSTAKAQPVMRLEMPSTTPPPLKKSHTELQSPPAIAGPQLPALLTDHDTLIDDRLEESDPPFRAPASWHTKPVVAHQDRYWNWSERSTAAFLGFATGILVIVPTVFFISATPDRPAPEVLTEISTAPPIEPTPPTLLDATVTTASMSSGTWFDKKAAPVPEASRNELINDSVSQAAVGRARVALSEGRITAARNTLRAAASPDTPHLWFVLAETYDPFVSRGLPASATNENLTDTDIKFAQYYYQQALTHGIGEASERLDALANR